MIAEQPITRDDPYKICFVCLGNICRSPTAEGVFRHLVEERDLQGYFEIDSAGTSAWHEGEPANIHSRETASRYGITLSSKARRFKSRDLDYYDLILVMDEENLSDVRQLTSEDDHETKIRLFREFDPKPGDKQVPDPYAGGKEGFEHVFEIVRRTSVELLDQLEARIGNEKV